MAALTVIAAAGGGSSGFHGGGGRGGGGGGIVWILLWLFLHPIALAFVVIAFGCFYLYNRAQTAHARARRGKRVRRVEIAAAEAAEDDEAFSPDAVRARAGRLFLDIQSAWDATRRDRLRALVGPDLMVEWERRLDDFDRRGWRNRVSVVDGPKVEYVSMTNRADDADDRVVVHVEATLMDTVVDRAGNHLLNHEGAVSPHRRLSEYWTLGKRDGRWTLLSIEQSAEGAHNLESDLVVTPWDDTARIRDEALVEGAAADKLPEHVSAGELVSVGYEHDARAAALDLSLVDGRFAPDVLEVAVRRVVEAWAEAVDGSDERLRALSSEEALQELLHPGDPSMQTRLVVRGPRVRSVTIEALDAHAEPPRMTVAVEAEGRRYVEDRDTARVVSGDPSKVTRFIEQWTLALDGDDANPWRIVYLIRNGRRARVG
jgi:predicted lipid-binding transport protein (Tim44 family)